MRRGLTRSALIGGIVGLVLVIVAVISVVFFDWRTEPPEKAPVVRPLKTIVIGEQAPLVEREFPGRVQASQRVELSFRVSDKLVELPVVEGQPIEAGSLIARLDKTYFQSRLEDAISRVEEADASLQAMRSGRPEDIQRLEAAVTQAESALQIAEIELAGVTDAFERGGATELEVQRRQADRDRRSAELRQAQENLNVARAGAREEDIRAAEARLRGLRAQRDQAQTDLDDCDLVAPFTGEIARRYVDNFQMIQAKEPVVSLHDVSHLDIVVAVPEASVIRAGDREPARIHATFAALPDREFDLSIKEFATEADPATQTYAATLTMPAPDDVNILPGMTATVFVQPPAEATADQAGFAAPIDVVPVDEQGRYFVWRVVESDDATYVVRRADVTVSSMTGDRVIIVSGVEAGDRIAAAGVHLLREGQRVTLLDSAGDGAS